MRINRTILRYSLGYKMPNNWLKMHGKPMRRKRALKEAEKINALPFRTRNFLNCMGGIAFVFKGGYEDAGKGVSRKGKKDE